ncbi:autotransporter-associated beta strand repeat-containing protein [Enhydrobacter aerosaccus]|uniref:Autotransporter-associated beta strand repeat-containing protein n=1 Tax=Enhydrobacter aerosaccus TaxID=225324 RepID=A0A1T4SGH6_9HYPH|nr:autotransporter domain-containing protein [Enhydrobacter aerosaccus]SKA27263.1 autotransporter-associated beta strand repeat-containing protein [Enhydrobacter aerosaccus]
MTPVVRWGVAAALVAGSSGVALGQNFVSQGPAPSVGPSLTVQSEDLAPTGDPRTSTGTVAGAIQAIAVDSVNAGTMYIGAVNGGVWKTQNGGASWTPLTDKQLSLSIATLAMDPTDTTGQKIYAGTGATSNSNMGGQKIGILYSANGGTSWSVLGSGTLDKSVIGVVARGSTIVAAESEPLNPKTGGGGLYISTNGGSTFSAVAGIPAGAVASLVSANDANAPLYAVVNSSDAATRGIYKGSSDGSTWTQISPSQVPIGLNQSARLAAGPNGSVVAGIYQYTSASLSSSSAKLVSLYLTQDGGAHWTPLTTPSDVNTGAQALTNLTLAIDPKNSSIVYVAGDASNPQPYTVPAFRVVLNPNGSSTVETLTLSGTSNNSAPHADSRAFAFDAAGNLILTEDGGIYLRTNPQSTNGTWTGMNVASLSVREGYAVAYDAIGKRLVISAQDTGSAYQQQPGGQTYTALGPADGIVAVVNDRTRAAEGLSAVYTSFYNLSGLTRWTYNAAGTQVAQQEFNSLNFKADDNVPFTSLMALNRNDPSKIAFGTNYLYTTVDTGAQSDTLDLTPRSSYLGNSGQGVTAIAYGTGTNVNALLVGANYSTQGLYYTASASSNLTNLSNYSGAAPQSLVFDYRSDTQFYVADGTKLWSGSAATAGGSFTALDLSGVNIIQPGAVEFISNNGVNALLVGGLSSIVGPLQSPLAVADSSAVGTLSPFRIFGANLPNTMVYQLAYNPTADVLAVSSFGRGAWLLYDVTTYFSSATTLIFGAANNNSTPTDAQLTAGTGAAAGRGLTKVGTGTLTIDGTSGYTGATTVTNGTLSVNGNITSSSGVTVGVNGTLGGNGFVPSTVVNGTLAPGNSVGLLSVMGNLTFNPGSTYQVQVGSTADRTNVSQTATLAGGAVQASFATSSFQRSYTILSAATVNGSFSSLTASGLPGFLNASLGYSPTSVSLNLQSAMASTPGLASNQSAVARAFDTAFNAGPGLGNMPALYGLSAGQLPSSLEMLSGDSASVTQSTAFLAGNQFASLMADRAITRRNEELACLDRADEAQACDVPPGWSAWTAGFGGAAWLNANGGTGAVASQQSVGGGAVGGDYRVGPDTLVGFAVGGSSIGYSMPGNGASGQATGVHFGAYALQDWNAFYINGSVVYSLFNGSMTRQIAGIGTTETERSLSTSSLLGGRLEIGRAFAIGSTTIAPFAALQPAQFWQPGMTETSTTANGTPGVFGLSYQAQSTTSLPSFLGAQLNVRTDVDSRPLAAWLRLAWEHEFMTGRPVTAGFTSLSGSLFTVDGATAASNAARIDLGARYTLNDHMSLFANAAAELSNRGQSIGGTAGFKWVW